ncbi:MAG: hypothetical protein EPO28_07050 [Saprospiraceae bacterium]|nr:MAG: hypothetical protein EPO28_07050 [Saprospiraceae bacterium]
MSFALNLPQQFFLAVAFVEGKSVEVHYVQGAFQTKPDFAVTSWNLEIKDLLKKTVQIGN